MRWQGIDVIAGPRQQARDRRRVLRRLLGELAPYRALLAPALGAVLVSAGAQMAGPWLVGRAIDHDIAARDLPALAGRMALLLAVYLLGAFAGRLQTRRIGGVGQLLLASLRERLFIHFQRLPTAFFDRQPAGDLLSRVGSDVDAINQLVSQGLAQLLGNVLGLLGILLAMAWLDWRLALACFSIIPVMVVATAVVASRARTAYRRTRETVGKVTAGIQEEIVGVREAQAFNRTEANIERFRQRNAANRDANVAATGIASAFSPMIDLLSTLGTALVIGFGGLLVRRGELTVGVVATFLLYVQAFFRPVQFLAAVWTQAQSALAGAERIYDVLDEATEPPDADDAIVLRRVEGRVEFEGVSFGYDPARPVLHDVSFTVAAGQTVALVGRTGAGKTTIAQLLARFHDVDAGVVRLDGHDVRRLGRGSLRSRLAMVPQEPFLFSASVADNIAYGRPEASRQEVEEAARAVSAHDFIAALPRGYDTPLGGEQGATLSAGQRQLLAFARAVLADPRLLILDEATAHIDTRTEQLLQRALRVVLAGRTALVIAHRLSTIRDADLILVIDEGRVVEQGRHEELLARGGRYADLYRRQFRDEPQGAPATAAG